MKEIITFFVVSGGVGFFNLYLAQETDFLYFGKYNKEERIAWLSIFTLINYFITTLYLQMIGYFHYDILVVIILFVLGIVLSFILSFVLPLLINWGIDYVRKFLKRSNSTYLPPINSFFQDIEEYDLYVFDFENKLINSGVIVQGTEERQENVSVVTFPTEIKDDIMCYRKFINKLVSHREDFSFIEYTDYNNKYHFVKVKEYK